MLMPGSLGAKSILHPKNHKSVISCVNFAFYGSGRHPNKNSSGTQIRQFWQQEFNLPNPNASIADTISSGITQGSDRNVASILNGHKFLVRLDAERATLPSCFWFTQKSMLLADQMSSQDSFYDMASGSDAEAIKYKNLFKIIIGFGRILSMHEQSPIIQFQIDSNQEPNNALGEALFHGGAENRDIWINWTETTEFEIQLET